MIYSSSVLMAQSVLSVAALAVRFLTKRFIGEYDQSAGRVVFLLEAVQYVLAALEILFLSPLVSSSTKTPSVFSFSSLSFFSVCVPFVYL